MTIDSVSMLQVIVVKHTEVMYLICTINLGQGCIAPEAEVNTNQIHRIPTCVQQICIHIEQL